MLFSLETQTLNGEWETVFPFSDHFAALAYAQTMNGRAVWRIREVSP